MKASNPKPIESPFFLKKTTIGATIVDESQAIKKENLVFKLNFSVIFF